MKKRTIHLICLTLACCMIGMVLAGCGPSKAENDETTKASENQTVSENSTEDSSASVPESSTEAAPTESVPEITSQESQAFVYIGTSVSQFKEYPVRIDGDVTAEKLIAAMADLTGWNLDLADAVFSGKGGMTVSFAPDCALVTGPPLNQKEEFTVYDNYGLAQMILDSIQETLRRNFVLEAGDPSSLDIWYNIDDQPINIEGSVVDMYLPWDEQNIFG